MTDSDLYLYVIVALLPLSACMLVFQVDPYHALVIRGILGAVAALVYAVLGAADVALTEALVGTMLAITLYAIAVRSSMSLRLGVLGSLNNTEATSAESAPNPRAVAESDSSFPDAATPVSSANDPNADFLNDMRTILRRHHMRLELVPYPSREKLSQALMNKEVHGICMQSMATQRDHASDLCGKTVYEVTMRVHRLYEIMQAECSFPTLRLVDISTANGAIAPDSLVPVHAATSEETHP
ncbi:MAG: DUF4040 domain-containing protein [Elainellaceae cyanobacterium]